MIDPQPTHRQHDLSLIASLMADRFANLSADQQQEAATDLLNQGADGPNLCGLQTGQIRPRLEGWLDGRLSQEEAAQLLSDLTQAPPGDQAEAAWEALTNLTATSAP